LILHPEDEPSGGLGSPRLQAPLESSKLSGLTGAMLVWIT
jgi:hypothetical protein